jgi:spore germination protein YaaH
MALAGLSRTDVRRTDAGRTAEHVGTDGVGRVHHIQRALLVAVVLLLLGPASAQGAGRVQAFLLAGAPDSFADLQAHASSVEVLYPTYYECAPGSGRIEGHDQPAIDAYAAAHDIPLLPRFNCQDGPMVEAILGEPALRARTLTGLYALAAHPAYAGLSLDLENAGAADRAALDSFVAALAARLHAMHRKLTVVVDGVPDEEPGHATYLYDYAALSAAANHVFVLAWGAHWEGSVPGPIAPLPWVREVIAHIASLPTARRFVLGEPLYGLDWAAGGQAGGGQTTAGGQAGGGQTTAGGQAGGGQATTEGPAGGGQTTWQRATALQFSGIAALIHTVGAKPQLDSSTDELTFAYRREGFTHRVWYLDARSVLDRLKLARAAGLAVGVWRLGTEDQSLWSSAVLE